MHKERVIVDVHNVIAMRRNLRAEPSAQRGPGALVTNRLLHLKNTRVVVSQQAKSVLERDSTLPFWNILFPLTRLHTADALDLCKQN